MFDLACIATVIPCKFSNEWSNCEYSDQPAKLQINTSIQRAGTHDFMLREKQWLLVKGADKAAETNG
jgi:hypothetical protein